MSNTAKTLLCLGDSYTIGEGVALHENFPYILLQQLRQNGLSFHAPEIVAKTGWTTFELLEHLAVTKIDSTFDFVTLLIGVNNQYRGLSTNDFKTDFEILLNKAINWANRISKNVIVLSIPDWGVTPFAADRNIEQIANEIDAYNQVCETVAKEHQTQFINITNSTRLAKDDISLLTNDQLHYSKIEHEKWATASYNKIKTLL